jgi:acetyl-CoA synthetase
MNNFNLGFNCTRFQCEQGKGSKVAMRWIDGRGHSANITFSDLDSKTNRFANVLRMLGIGSGEVVFTFLPKCPEQFYALLGSLKMECITGALFSNFGNEALVDRLGDCRAVLVVTTKSHYGKMKPAMQELPSIRYILIVDSDENLSESVLSFRRLMEKASDDFEIPCTPPETPSVIHYTSGSTGKPKGVLHCHRSILHQSFTCSEILGLKDDDIYWCTADQGWVTGVSYGIIGPWGLGVTQVHYGGAFKPQAWMDLLEQEKVTVWYTAPTALRMLMREDDSIYTSRSLPVLRTIYSVGEPLNPEVITWARRTLRRDIYDTWWQTETGGIMVANRPGIEIRPGSMGIPVEGITIGILDRDGTEVRVGGKGSLCVKTGWASMFITYLNNESAYRSKFRNGWYYTGDMASRDADGYVWFMGRDDDVINTSGHLISPFEIESCLLELPEIFESGVIGAPDELLYEKIVAFVHLKEGSVLNAALELKIRSFLARRLSSTAIPQEIITVPSVPKNKSGKIMRRFLKAQYLGQDAGDLSTLDVE